MASLSIVIPTINRPEDLRRLLQSIIAQKVCPNEVIVVDQSSDDRTRELCEEYSFRITELKYVRARKRSLTAARNTGVGEATSDYVGFLDDDIILHEEYVSSILEAIEDKPSMNLMMGWIENQTVSTGPSNILRFLLGFDYYSKKSFIRKNFQATYLSKMPSNPVPIEHANGTMVVKRRIAIDLQFDEKLVMYALGEDRDFSYRVQRKFGGLYLIPKALLTHNESTTARITNKQKVFMQSAHSLYLLYKNLDVGFNNIALFSWNWLIRFLIGLIYLFIKPLHGKNVIASICFMIRNRHDFAKGDLHQLYKEMNYYDF